MYGRWNDVSCRYFQDADRVNHSIGLHNQTIGFIGAGCIAQATLVGMMDKGETNLEFPSDIIVNALPFVGRPFIS